MVITHLRLERRGAVAESLECLPSWKHPDRESQERYYCRIARNISPALHKVVYEILCTDDPLAIRRVRGILSLAKKYTRDVIEDAAHNALACSRIRYDQFKTLCERYTLNTQNRNNNSLTQEHELIRSLNEYETLITERTQL